MTAGKFDFIETDRRIVEQKLRKHQLSQSEQQKYLKGLPDEKEHAEELHVPKEGEKNASGAEEG